jgi:outer membrane protein TolC
MDAVNNPALAGGDDLTGMELEALLRLAFANRPDLAEQSALVDASRDRLRAARTRPWAPSLTTNVAYGGFGGSPIRDPFVNVIDPRNGPVNKPLSPSGEIHRFGPRTEMVMGMSWQLEGMGLGNRTEIREQRVGLESSQLRYTAVRDRVAAQVVQAQESVRLSQERWNLTRTALFNDKDEPTGPAFRSIRLNFERIRGTEGRPLEALDSIRGLNDILDAYTTALSEYERARLRLLGAIGLLR